MDAWGIKGWIKVQPFSSDPQALLKAKRWHLGPDARPQRSSLSVPVPRSAQASAHLPAQTLQHHLDVLESRVHNEAVVARIEGVPDRNAAEALKGLSVWVSRQDFPTTASDEYYWVDLMGLQVYNRQGEFLGVVNDLLDTGPHAVLQLDTERLIPFVSAYVDSVSLADKKIQVDWGLDF